VIRQLVAKTLQKAANRIAPPPPLVDLIPEVEPWQAEIIATSQRYSMTPPLAQWTLLGALTHIHRHRIPGDFVECGVWRGGNLILAGLVCKRLGMSKTIWGYDTYAGMTPPTDFDKKHRRSLNVKEKFARLQHDDHNDWCYASLADVTDAFAREVGAACEFKPVKGPVQETLLQPPLPESIALLRLDTDFYDSTKVELEVLYPRLVSGGLLIIDDYGAWAGAQKAVDEYFRAKPVWLQYVTHDVRLVVKP
jgi:hypothetical protein